MFSDLKVRAFLVKIGLWKCFWNFCSSPGLVMVIERVQKCSHGTEMKTYFLCLKWVSNPKILAQNSKLEKTDHLLGKVTEIFFQTLIKQWPGDLGKIWYHFSVVFGCRKGLQSLFVKILTWKKDSVGGFQTIDPHCNNLVMKVRYNLKEYFATFQFSSERFWLPANKKWYY